MSFITDFFGKGGTGSSLLDTGGNLALGLVQNEGAKIQGDYQIKLKQLTNDASLSQAQFQIELAKLNAERDGNLATYNDQKRNDTLIMVSVVGGLLLIATVSVLLILKTRKPKP